MQEFLNNIIPNVMAKLPDFYAAIGDTLLMVVWSGAISFVLGLALGVLLTVTKPGGILENKVVYQIVDKLVSLFRSIPFIILLVGFEFFKTSLDRIIHPSAVAFSALLTGILAVSMLVKLWMGLFNTTLGRRIDSPVLIAAGQDSRNDVITTSVVVLGMVAGRFTPLPVDGYVGILVAAFIIWSGIGIARDTVAPLLGEAADPVMAKNIEHIVLDSEHIVGVHDLIIHNYGAGRALASLHAEVPSDSNFVAVHEEIDEAEKRVWQQTGVYLVIHMDPIDVNNEHINALREQVDGVLRGIDEQLSMHDFRVVDGERQINLIFDVVVPFSYDDEGKRRLLMTIYDDLKAIDQRFNPVVTLDHAM